MAGLVKSLWLERRRAKRTALAGTLRWTGSEGQKTQRASERREPQDRLFGGEDQSERGSKKLDMFHGVEGMM